MSNLKLFRRLLDGAQEVAGSSVALEKPLQSLIERNVEPLLGVRFLTSEHRTGKAHGGRIDTLGLGEHNEPVIIEYKRALNENVINQGLYYLNWLADHRADYKLLVLENVGSEAASAIEWDAARVICIAGDFTKFDVHAVHEIGRNIDLIRYRRYGDDLLALELVATASSGKKPILKSVGSGSTAWPPDPTTPIVLQKLAQCSAQVHDAYAALGDYIQALGEDVQEKTLKHSIAYSRIRRFAAIEFRPSDNTILLYLNLDGGKVGTEPGFSSVKEGESGVWAYKVAIQHLDHVERAKPLILKSYDSS